MATPSSLELPSLQKLQSTEQSELLNVVDTLRARGLSEIVALPQLIVCGDQSSGKSSVLEAISGIPFPRQETLCTRFATEVILRRATTPEITVSILPGRDRTIEERDELLEFHHGLRTTDDFGVLFDTATKAMGLSPGGKSFSNDVLRIEFCGPSQPQLTLVDLPGLIHSAIKPQTAQDVTLVHSLVTDYLKNPRSIILAVVSAMNDCGNQVILDKARGIDPQGLRTLGIITKPDMLTRGSKNEDEFIALASNEKVRFSLGWHVVRNLDSVKEKDQLETRDVKEDLYFKESKFNSLPPHFVGISFLRHRLSKVLFEQIRTELPRLVDDISTQISLAKTIQTKLGPRRATLVEQRFFLTSLSQDFQRLCRDAVRGDYEDEFLQVDCDPDRLLCSSIMKTHFDFAEDMRKNGACWIIIDPKAKTDFMHSIKRRTRKEAIESACILLKKSRGRELPGLPNPLLVGELFREYSRPWGSFARAHIKNVWDITLRFLKLLLRYLTDDDAAERILRFWLLPIMEDKLNSAYSKLDELLEVHRDHPMTTNSQFINTCKKRRRDKIKDEIKKRVQEEFAVPGEEVQGSDITRIFSSIELASHTDMDMMAAEEAFDNMNAFYEIAISLFTDNVPTLAIQAPIIRRVPDILCPTAVLSMDADILKRIAGEEEEKSLERDAIVHRLAVLENSARVCKQYAKRSQTSLVTPMNAKPNLASEVETQAVDGEKAGTPAKEAISIRSNAKSKSASRVKSHAMNGEKVGTPAKKPTSDIFASPFMAPIIPSSDLSTPPPTFYQTINTSTMSTPGQRTAASKSSQSLFSFGARVPTTSSPVFGSITSVAPTYTGVFGNPRPHMWADDERFTASKVKAFNHAS